MILVTVMSTMYICRICTCVFLIRLSVYMHVAAASKVNTEDMGNQNGDHVQSSASNATCQMV